jgi:hypothetical protein
MSHRNAAPILALPGFLVFVCLAMAQQNTGGPTGSKDPTTPSAKLKQIMSAAKVGPQAPRLPPLILRGRVIAKDRTALAVLEVEGIMYTVGKGSLSPGGVYRVHDVTSGEIVIDVERTKEKMVLR